MVLGAWCDPGKEGEEEEECGEDVLAAGEPDDAFDAEGMDRPDERGGENEKGVVLGKEA